ncbi:hypothetical protein LOC67_26090 [Stieleria sp. JC731]|uniref:hypothetical protein n=1 Tax=Pirellulaceae TaxID=2691357 RepID=UPI001E3F2C33|nr:hypothetical protein [Stieleria sp. JC731]MCC9604039.1 hypothetical protein [Stieleria sp. JC731]
MIDSPYEPPSDTSDALSIVDRVREFTAIVCLVGGWAISLDGVTWGAQIGFDIEHFVSASPHVQAFMVLLIGVYMVYATSLFLLATSLRSFQRIWVGVSTATLVTATAITWYFQLDIPAQSLWRIVSNTG